MGWEFMSIICSFFGHREVWCDLSMPLEEAIRRAITEYGATEFWVGGYGAFDSAASGVVRRLKKEYPGISLHLIYAYLPHKEDVLSAVYDSTIYPEGLELVPRRFAISKRNQWIVNNSDLVIAYVNHNYGGAYTAFRFAKKKGIPIINIGNFC